MKFNIYGEKGLPTLFLLPGLGVSHEIFLPLIERLKDRFYIIAAGVDGFILGEPFRTQTWFAPQTPIPSPTWALLWRSSRR